MLRIPHYLDSQLIDGGKVVSLTQWPRSNPQKRLLLLRLVLVCQKLSKSYDLGKLGKVIKSYYLTE
jgi:hypothetical protein